VSDDREEDQTPESAQRTEPPSAAFRLRPERPRVTRLSRKVLAGGAAVALLAVSGAVIWALQNKANKKPAPEELYATDHHTTADGRANLPRDYAGVPRQAPPLGPPLPGDLGRPILNAQGQSAATGVPGAADPEAQRQAQEMEAARLSKLFASTNIRELPMPPTAPAAPLPDAGAAANQIAQPSADAAFAQNGQDRKLAFVTAAVDRRTTSPDRLGPRRRLTSCRRERSSQAR
jgi:type IV secretory pathway VirB10-like protein